MKPNIFVASLKKVVNPLKDPKVLAKAKELHSNCATSYYEVGRSALSDAEFDLLEARIKKADPKWKPPIGAPVKNKKLERPLAVPCPSLDKIKFEKPEALTRFLGTMPPGMAVRIESKIDGATVLAEYPSGVLKSLTTRGDGINGKSIDGFILPSQRPRGKRTGLVLDLDTRRSYVLRFEAVMRKDVYAEKYADKFDSTRVIASAAFNRSVPDTSLLKDMDFVLIGGFVEQNGTPRVMSPEALDKLAAHANLIRPAHCFRNIGMTTPEELANVLEKLKTNGHYDLDGLVIGPREPRLSELVASEENPKHMKAFKVDDMADAPETTIEEIIWNVSSFGVLVPKARVTPIKFGNVTVTQAALHNVVWAKERGAGVGATVRILRAGEIIPKIVQVLKPVKFTMPSRAKYGDYELQGTKLTLKSAETNEVRVKKLARMFSILGLDSLGGGLAKKMVEAGFDTTAKACLMTLEDFEALPGVKGSAVKFAAEINKVRSGQFTAARLFLASCVSDAGIGDTQMKKLVRHTPEALSSRVVKQDILALSKVLGPAFASTFAQAWPKFRDWMKEVRPKVAPLQAPVSQKKGVLTGQFFSWTGYRAKDEEAFVTNLGGEVVPFGKKTTVLFYRPGGKASTKVSAAGPKAKQFPAWINTFKGAPDEDHRQRRS
jgi:DNA ligase (NAD+)